MSGLKPTRWWRVLTPSGAMWMETSDEQEAREEAQRTGYELQRLHQEVSTHSLWVPQ